VLLTMRELDEDNTSNQESLEDNAIPTTAVMVAFCIDTTLPTCIDHFNTHNEKSKVETKSKENANLQERLCGNHTLLNGHVHGSPQLCIRSYMHINSKITIPSCKKEIPLTTRLLALSARPLKGEGVMMRSPTTVPFTRA
jgi:hypothetical protein